MIAARDVAGNPIFKAGLEYSSPARGSWTIAHVSMLIPGSLQIFVGGDCCLRGVVLSAAEFGGLDRFAMITLKDDDVFSDRLELMFIDGITEILEKREALPPAVIVFTNCVHEFSGCDMDYVYSELSKRFPSIDFIPSKMNPTMRKSGMTPEELMRKQLYAPLKKISKEKKSVNILGNVFARSENCELLSLLARNGFTLRDICLCETYSEYLEMARSDLNIYMLPVMRKGAEFLSERLGQRLLYLPVSFDFGAIDESLRALARECGFAEKIGEEFLRGLREKTEAALLSARDAAKNFKIAIDYAAVSRPFELARLLLERGFNVQKIFTDLIPEGDEKAFDWIKRNKGDLQICAASNFKSRFLHNRADRAENFLAIGQKAAYFCATNHFVNIVENDGLWGYGGIQELSRMIESAALNESDMRELIQVKAWGCRG